MILLMPPDDQSKGRIMQLDLQIEDEQKVYMKGECDGLIAVRMGDRVRTGEEAQLGQMGKHEGSKGQEFLCACEC